VKQTILLQLFSAWSIYDKENFQDSLPNKNKGTKDDFPSCSFP
jgi:hypothetical protein